MKYQSLNGEWSYRIGKGAKTSVTVPYSCLAVGHSECELCFDLEQKSEHIFLEFLGITYEASVYLNETFLGKMLPYSEYRFEIGEIAKQKENILRVELEDIKPKFGPTEGWENFGGIIRDVGILYADSFYFEDVFFWTDLKNNYKDAEVNVQIKASLDKECDVKLFLKGKEICAFKQSSNTEAVAVAVNGVELWSPDSPTLYQLEVSCGEEKYCHNVGFREITCDKHAILLNGEPCFIKGVCKHEMFGDSGHTPTVEQMETDLRMIKNAGCNFVRLVHYPHNKKILDLADKIGLMVSEEPGLWWSDTSDKEVAEGSIEVLKRTIMRDRNHPSIAFWLCFNECRFTEQFLIDSAKACKEYDPTRMVSGANCMSLEDTKKYYNICGFDFYTMHPYAPTFERSKISAEYLTDKPLIFTEWGGYYVYDNPHLLKDFIIAMKKLFVNRSDEAALAGMCFWEWSELNDFNRGRPACIDGVLREGLTDKYRNPTMIFPAFCEALSEEVDNDFTKLYEYEQLCEFSGKPMTGTGGKDFAECLTSVDEPIPEYRIRMRARKTAVGPKLQKQEVEAIATTPFVVANDYPVVFSGDGECDSINIIGAVAMPYGYPIAGEYGEAVAEVEVTFENGEKQIFGLKNGVDITTVLTTLGSSRINPVAENAKPFAKFSYEKNRENYQINMLNLAFGEVKSIKEVTVRCVNEKYNILIYGIYC
ncbi:MAG: hypothetical protein E7524_02315 [Ruminococcaceae bacterium]|nr:hypothetical protein [Oscillospiraceae bacterium]